MTLSELTQEFHRCEEMYQEEDSRTFQHLLETDLRWLDRIIANEQVWLDQLRQGQVPFNFALDREITQCYQHWVAKAEIRLRQLELQTEKGFQPPADEIFRQRLEETRAILAQRLRDERMAHDRAELIQENGDR